LGGEGASDVGAVGGAVGIGPADEDGIAGAGGGEVGDGPGEVEGWGARGGGAGAAGEEEREERRKNEAK